jgi:hypothetical protein
MPSIPAMPCPICKLQANEVRVREIGERITLECGRCGKFTITATAESMAKNLEPKPKLSAWIRERSDTGGEIAEINSQTLTEVEAALPSYRVAEKQLLLLRALERYSNFPGKSVNIVPHLHYPLAWASNENEFRYLMRSVVNRRLVDRVNGVGDFTNSLAFDVELTTDGWTFLEERARPSVISNQVFVAMAFAEDLLPAWKHGIEPALVKAGFNPYRVDAAPHIDRIDAKIVSEIKNSKFLVADVTLQRQGVVCVRKCNCWKRHRNMISNS